MLHERERVHNSGFLDNLTIPNAIKRDSGYSHAFPRGSNAENFAVMVRTGISPPHRHLVAARKHFIGRNLEIGEAINGIAQNFLECLPPLNGRRKVRVGDNDIGIRELIHHAQTAGAPRLQESGRDRLVIVHKMSHVQVV